VPPRRIVAYQEAYCQQHMCLLHHEIKEKPQLELCELLAIMFLLAIKEQGAAGKPVSHRIEGELNLLKILTALPFLNTYQMSQL
jgi:hypothetical protein